MAEQSFLNKLGLRLGILGSSAALAIAAPLATGNYDPSCHTDAARIGFYFDRSVGMLGIIVGGQTGPLYTKSGSTVTAKFTGVVTVGDGTVSATFNINGAAGTNRGNDFQTNASDRFRIIANGTAESGSDAGTNLILQPEDDSGVSLATNVFNLGRAALAAWTLQRPLTIAAGTLTGTQTAFNVTATWSNIATTFSAGLNLNPVMTAHGNSKLVDLRISGVSRFSIGAASTTNYGQLTSAVVDDGTGVIITSTRTTAITTGVTDALHWSFGNTNINGIFTVTRFNWFELDTPTGTSTVTNGTVFDFDAAAGTHCALDVGTTKTSPGTVSAWIKHNINGTIYFSNAYTSKTS